MRVRLALLAVSLLVLASGASAGIIPVVNPSFETIPNSGFFFCGGTCQYTGGVGIPGWTTAGDFFTGQWMTGGFNGNPNAYDGSWLAYTNGGTISQNVATVGAPAFYTLQVEILHRTDAPLLGVAQLTLNGVPVATATGSDNGPGTWNLFTATLTTSPADAGKTLGIELSSIGTQGDWDAVQLSVPDVSNLATLLGFGIFNVAAVFVVRRKLS